MEIKKELGPSLSSKTHILLPRDEAFAPTAQRWNPRFPIIYCAIIDASCEEDVASAIKYANKRNVPFLALNGGHGAQYPLLNFQNGICITTLQMKSLTLNETDGGKTVWLKGSWLSGDFRDELFKLGKRTAHGSCDSTGVIGPMLGGGHGILQGRYGLLADQIVELRLVLADGQIITVSEDSHAELFWAMRGAGHNFGIVTAVRYKVYEIPAEDVWTHTTMTFAGDKLEVIVPVLNEILAQQPVEMAVLFPIYLRLPDVDAENPVIAVHMMYEGPESSNAFVEPVKALGPLAVESQVTTWQGASESLGFGRSSPSNQKDLISTLRMPLGLNTFHLPSMRKAYRHFAAGTAAQPKFAFSFIVWEGYSTQAVKAVPDEATAVSDRGDTMLVAPMICYEGSDWKLDEEAGKFGEELRKILLEGQEKGELHAYVNYAQGDEGLKEMYGHETWRLEKLKRLKQEYDPDNRFRFYSPIVSESPLKGSDRKGKTSMI